MATRYRLTQVPIEQVEPGMSLAIEDEDGGHRLFQVERKVMSHNPPEPLMFRLESEPVDGGEPWVIEGPPGTLLVQILGTYDDGT
jgi:hypothetical protein